MTDYLDDTTYMDDPTCPYCGHKETDTCEMDHSENQSTHYCGSCGKQYLYSANIRISWDTYKADCLNGADHPFSDWEPLYSGWETRSCQTCNHRENRQWSVRKTNKDRSTSG